MGVEAGCFKSPIEEASVTKKPFGKRFRNVKHLAREENIIELCLVIIVWQCCHDLVHWNWWPDWLLVCASIFLPLFWSSKAIVMNYVLVSRDWTAWAMA
jgi:hypothetical protein